MTQQREDDNGCVCSVLPDEVGAEGVLMCALSAAGGRDDHGRRGGPGMEVAQDVPVERS